MEFRKILAVTGALALGLTSVPASATDLVLDSGWQTFSYDGAGSSWDQAFTFDLTGSAELQVTDAYLSGDRFEIFFNLVSQGLTSDPTSTGDFIGGDFASAFLDARWSSGSYLLGPGSYSITGIATLSPFQGGDGGIQLVSAAAVPEPGTWAMMILGFGFVGGAMRSAKRRHRVSVSQA